MISINRKRLNTKDIVLESQQNKVLLKIKLPQSEEKPHSAYTENTKSVADLNEKFRIIVKGKLEGLQKSHAIVPLCLGLLPVDKLDSDFPAADYLLASPHHRVAPSPHLDTD